MCYNFHIADFILRISYCGKNIGSIMGKEIKKYVKSKSGTAIIFVILSRNWKMV